MPLLYNQYNSNKCPIAPIYLFGEPGVGKTRFVEQVANIINARLVAYASPQSPGYATWTEHGPFENKNMNFISRGIKDCKDQKKDCVVLFLDELDKLLIPKNRYTVDPAVDLLKLLNIGNTSVKDDYLGYEVNIENVLIVAAGNTELHKIDIPEAEALSTRFVKVHFSNLNDDMKLDIAFQRFKYRQSQDSSVDLTASIHQKNIKRIASADKHPGARQLLAAVDNYINQQMCANMFHGTPWGTQLAHSHDHGSGHVFERILSGNDYIGSVGLVKTRPALAS